VQRYKLPHDLKITILGKHKFYLIAFFDLKVLPLLLLSLPQFSFMLEQFICHIYKWLKDNI